MYAIAALTLVALLVRIPGLGSGLWADEIWAVMESIRTPFPHLLADFPGDNKHPLYALLAHASMTVFGEHAWSVRLPALLFGVATVPLLYALGLRITTRAESLAAAALLAVSYHHVWFSQNARGYTMLAFWAVLTTLLLVHAMRERKTASWIWYGIAAGFGAYTQLTFIFTVVAQALVALLGVAGIPRQERRLDWKEVFLGFGLSVVVTVLLYAPMLGQVINFFLHKESNLRGISSPSWALAEGVRVLRLGFGGAFGVGLAVIALGGVVACVGVISYARQSLRVLLLLLLPAVVTLLGAFTARGTMYPRFFFGLLGFAILIGMRGAFASGGWLAERAGLSKSFGNRVGFGAASIVVLVSALSLLLNWRAPKQDFEGAMRFAEASVPANEVIVTTDVTGKIYGPFYHTTWRDVRSDAELEALRSQTPVWLIYTFPRYLMKYDPKLAATVERECRSARVFPGTVGGGDIIVCRLERT
jgi:uncharacterized membrane protein